MSVRTTNYKYQGVDLSNIFQDGSTNIVTNYKVDGTNLGTLFAKYTTGPQLTYNVGYDVSGVDFRFLFAPKS